MIKNGILKILIKITEITMETSSLFGLYQPLPPSDIVDFMERKKLEKSGKND